MKSTGFHRNQHFIMDFTVDCITVQDFTKINRIV